MRSTQRLLSIPSPWFDVGTKEESAPVALPTPTPAELEAVRTRCEALYREQLAAFSAHQSKHRRSDAFFADSVMKQGTLSDKLAATALQVRDDPFFSLPQLRFLVASSAKKGRREAQLAAQHVVDLLVSGTVIPKSRTLVSLAKRPVGGGSESYGNTKRLLIWFFEDQLKVLVASFVKALEEGTRDQMDYHKDSCLKMVYRLLCEVPEREKENLAIVINKAGDSTKRIASRVPYLLGMLVQQHSNMRAAVVAEVERYLYKPSTPVSGQYYLTIFLTQVALHRGESDLAKNLIQVYFAFLHKLVEKKLEEKNDDDEMDEKAKKNALRKKKKKRKMAKQAEISTDKLLHMKAKASKLNSKMLTALLTGVTRAFPYLEKGQEGMFDSHIDTFFKVVYTASFNKACHAVALLLKIMVARGAVSDRFYQAIYYMLMHPDLRSSSKQALFLNVLYGGIKHDKSIVRVRAFVKRLLQVALHERSNFVCAALVVVSETMRLHEQVRDCIRVPEVPEEDDIRAAEAVRTSEHAGERARQLAQLKAMKGLEGDDDDAGGKKQGGPISTRRVYNPLKENPLRSNADNSCAWELLLLAEHNHPTVSLFAKQLLELKFISYDGDPLLDFSLASFLDRFAYKAPKKNPKRVPAEHESKYDKKRISFSSVAPAADSREFVEQDESAVRPEERFMFEYMKQRNEKKKKMSKNDNADDEDEDLLMDNELEQFGSSDLEGDDLGGGDFMGDDDDDDGGDDLDIGDDDDDDEEEGDIEFDEDEMEEDDEDDNLGGDDDDDGANAYMWADDGLASAFEMVEEQEEKDAEEEKHTKQREAKMKLKSKRRR